MRKQRNHRFLFAKDLEWGLAPEGVHYVPFRTDPDDRARPLSVLSEYPPNHRVAPHTHACDYIEIVLEGVLTVGKVQLAKGDVRIMKGGMGYGPLTSGPDGCRVLTIFDRADGSVIQWKGA